MSKLQKMKDAIKSIRGNLKLLDSTVPSSRKGDEYFKINGRQAEAVKQVLQLLRDLSWQLPFNECKELKYDHSDPLFQDSDTGRLVRIRPCDKEYKEKSFLGFYLGEIAQSIVHLVNPEDNSITAKRSFYNPAIFIPDLGKTIFGGESWWNFIEHPDEAKDLISDEDIKAVWYVQALEKLT